MTRDAFHQPDPAFASHLDSLDALSAFRSRFLLPADSVGNPLIYFCGHSLGLQPRTVESYVKEVLADWAALGVEGHFKAARPWLSYHELLTAQIARLVGATPVEVVAMNTLTVNLHLMMVSFYRPTPSRHKILIEPHAFPSDQYAVKSQIRFHGYDPSKSLIEFTPREGETVIRQEDIEALLDKEGASIALIMLGGVNYYSGQVFDMEQIVKAGQAKGCIVAFDLAHAAGNIPLHLHDWNVDFAVWCSYKYLNAGPGSTAGCFVHERHASALDLPRFAGWWGHSKQTRFKMGPEFEPIPGAEGWQVSNPPILPLAALRASLEVFDEAGMEKLRAKSMELTGYLEFLVHHYCSEEISILTPEDPSQRGCQLSLHIHKNGRRVFESLSDNGVVCDWREPDVIRVAPVPLYNTFGEVFGFVEILRRSL